VGISVSRVGGAAQLKGIKKVSGTLKLELAQYRSLEAFAMFASDLDAASRKQLERGARLTELLKQPQFSPYPVEDQTVSIWAGTTGKLDEVPVQDILRFEREFLDYLKRNTSALTVIRETEKLEDDTVNELEKAIEHFKKMFQLHTGEPLVKAGKEEVKALADEQVGQEKIVIQKR
jgi:F-type H+-transporting ATPase subunit alpha